MASFRVNLPPRSLVGVYSRLVRRELGLPTFQSRSIYHAAQGDGLFARSLAVALGEAFAAGDGIRAEFAIALSYRLRQYMIEVPSPLPLAEVLGHAVVLSEMVAADGNIEIDAVEISHPIVARETEADINSPREIFYAGRFQRPLWTALPAPEWWQHPAAADKWVGPMGRLGEPIWTSTQLSGEDLVYLLNFGLESIDSNPQLIQPWTESVSNLVAAASRPRANIRELVDCCRVKP